MGRESERHQLLQFMQQTYEELYPGNTYPHLQDVIHQYWSANTPYWLVSSQENTQESVACLWLGTAVDQVTGDAYTHIFMLFVVPSFRRQGIGTALMHTAENWANQRGDQQLGLQVFTHAQPALSLYDRLDFQPRAILLMKDIGKDNQ